jgi:hypothetical protein
MSENVNKESSDFLFGQLQTKLDLMDTAARDRHTEVMTKLEKHDDRIGKLERIKQWAVGGAAVGGSGGIVAWWNKIFGA